LLAPASWQNLRRRRRRCRTPIASGDGDKLDWSKVRGLLLAGGDLYSATGSGDDVFRIDFHHGRPVPGTYESVD
jgi:hypothetical protein